MSSKLVLAIELAEYHHKGEFYGSSNLEYTYHLSNVVDKVKFLHGTEACITDLYVVAWLHDIIEDTECSENDLRVSFGDSIADSVMAITKIEGESLHEYYLRVISNEIAFKVKIADTLSNLEHS